LKKTVDRLIETKTVEPPVLAGADEASQDKPIKPQELICWWLDWMRRTPTPFAERMTFFWHGHFTSDFRKVNLQTPFIYWQNLTWRRMSLGNLHDMLYQVTTDPAMLRYLDLGTSTGKAPNENYSRELMELFTLGIGNYSEDDVKAAARAFTGWNLRGTDFLFDDNQHDAGDKTFLGQSGNLDGTDILNNVVNQLATAQRIVGKLFAFFAYPNPEPEVMAPLVDVYTSSGHDISQVVEASDQCPYLCLRLKLEMPMVPELLSREEIHVAAAP